MQNWSKHLRVDFRKIKVIRKGDGTGGSSIWLIFTYIVQSFTLILMIIIVFRKTESGRSYANFKFLHTSFREKFINFLFLSQIDGPLVRTLSLWFWFFLAFTFKLCLHNFQSIEFSNLRTGSTSRIFFINLLN